MPSPAVVRAHIWVSGGVQGVGYRAFTQRVAVEKGLCGGVRNLEDGRVEVEGSCLSNSNGSRLSVSRRPIWMRLLNMIIGQ
jgi:hypothetical protein